MKPCNLEILDFDQVPCNTALLARNSCTALRVSSCACILYVNHLAAYAIAVCVTHCIARAPPSCV